MPYICLANANVPDGTLQITDLWPNVSQDNNPTNPPGQTSYLRRPATDTPYIDGVTGLVTANKFAQQFEGLGAYLIDRVEPATVWSEALVAANVAAIQNLVDTGVAATLVAVDAALVGAAGAPGLTAGASTATLAELLSILAGRSYVIPAGAVKDAAGWVATQRGSFTAPNTVYDTGMSHGEWGPVGTGQKWHLDGGGNNKPVFTGGDTVNNEVGDIRVSYHGTALAASLASGQLFRYTSGITLFPDAAVQAHIAPTMVSKQSRQATLVNQRLVTVYDDDGTLLA